MATSSEQRLDPRAGVAQLPLLASLDGPMLDELAALGVLQEFSAGSVLFRELDSGDALYLVLSGFVRVVANDPDGNEVEVALLGPGEALGEFAILDGLPRGGTAIADTDVGTLTIDRGRFLGWLERRPGAAIALLGSLSSKLRQTSSGMIDVVSLDLRARLSKRLLLLRRRDPEGPIRVTQEALARSLGVTREAVNKELRSMQIAGAVERGRGRIRILALEQLESIAAGD